MCVLMWHVRVRVNHMVAYEHAMWRTDNMLIRHDNT